MSNKWSKQTSHTYHWNDRANIHSLNTIYHPLSAAQSAAINRHAGECAEHFSQRIWYLFFTIFFSSVHTLSHSIWWDVFFFFRCSSHSHFEFFSFLLFFFCLFVSVQVEKYKAKTIENWKWVRTKMKTENYGINSMFFFLLVRDCVAAQIRNDIFFLPAQQQVVRVLHHIRVTCWWSQPNRNIFYKKIKMKNNSLMFLRHFDIGISDVSKKCSELKWVRVKILITK